MKNITLFRMVTMFSLFSFIAGLGLFLYGMKLISDGFEYIAAHNIRNYLKKISHNPIYGLLIGIVITSILQSSSAASVIVVSLVSAKIINLSFGLSIILGTAIGTTVTLQLLAFDIYGYTLLLLGIGAVFAIFTKGKLKFAGTVLFGFGVLFHGMKMMTESLAPMTEHEWFVSTLLQLQAYPFVIMLIGILMTSIVQSSSATIAIAISLASNGFIDLSSSLAFVLGANIGTSSTALISSITSTQEGRQVAFANTFFKIAGALLFFLMLPLIEQWLSNSTSDIDRQIANANTLYNIAVAVLGLPFIHLTARLVKRMFPEKEEERFFPKQIVDVPEVALNHTSAAVKHLAHNIKDRLFSKLPELLNGKKLHLEKETALAYKEADQLYQGISDYLTRMGQQEMASEFSEVFIKQLLISNDLRDIASMIKTMTDEVKQLQNDEIRFSEQGKLEIDKLLMKTNENYCLIMEMIKNNHEDAVQQVITNHEDVIKLEYEYRLTHSKRLMAENKDALSSSALHQMVLTHIARLSHHIASMARTLEKNT